MLRLFLPVSLHLPLDLPDSSASFAPPTLCQLEREQGAPQPVLRRWQLGLVIVNPELRRASAESSPDDQLSGGPFRREIPRNERPASAIDLKRGGVVSFFVEAIEPDPLSDAGSSRGGGRRLKSVTASFAKRRLFKWTTSGRPRGRGRGQGVRRIDSALRQHRLSCSDSNALLMYSRRFRAGSSRCRTSSTSLMLFQSQRRDQACPSRFLC